MSARKPMRRALGEVLVPGLESLGFVGKHPSFRRAVADKIQILSVYYDKWGGAFFLEFGQCDAQELEGVPLEDLEAAHIPLLSRARLVAYTNAGNPSKQFFRYADFSDDIEKCRALAEEVVRLLPQVNDWLHGDQVGDNISAFAA